MATGEDALKVVLLEIEQLHDTIGRALGSANALFGLVLPAAFGVLGFTAGKDDLHFSPGVLSFALAGVVAMTLVYNAGLWVEISRYLRFKYAVLYPEMHRLAGLVPRENVGAFLARAHLEGPPWATLAFHTIAHVVTVAIIFGAMRIGEMNRWFVGMTLVLLSIAVATTLWASVEIKKNMAFIRDAAPARTPPAP